MSGRYRRALALILLLTALGSAQKSAQAAELIMFQAPGCTWCEAWDEEIGGVYSKTEEGRTAPLRRVDIDDFRPSDLEAVTGVVYTPTFVLLDAGQEIGRILGYPGEYGFWGQLGELLKRLPAPPQS